MGLRWLFHPRPEIGFDEYGSKVHEFRLPGEGLVEYARWQHPFETPKEMTQEAVDSVRHFVNPGDFVIDIGAHTGDTTVPMALAAGPTGCTLALEPNPYVFKVLAKNATLNLEKTQIIPKCFAATAEDGKFVFHYTDASFANGGFKSQQKWPLFRRRHPLKVEGRNLERILRDEFADWLPQLTYVKVDAEGYDAKVLRSILPTLRETKPVIRAEVFRKLIASERYALYDLLADLDCDIFHYQPGDKPLGKHLSRQDINREKHFDIVAVPTERAAKIAA
jgi:FkbM family methyltransferase